MPVTFVGHPLVDLVHPPADRDAFVRGLGLDAERPVVALLPGSRPKEIAHNLPPLAGAVERLAGERPDLQFLLALAPSLSPRAVAETLGSLPVHIVANQAQGVLAAGTVSVVASGTATVEAALLGAPMVVVYRLAPVTYLLGEIDILPLGGFDSSCPAMAQGANRLARGRAYGKYVNDKYGAGHQVTVVPLCGHNARCMFTAEVALPLLFPK